MEFNAYEITPATLIGIGAAFASSITAAAVLYRRGKLPLARAVWAALAAASGLAVLLITLSPGRHGGTYPCEFSGSPFEWLRGNQSTANVAMLVPVAVALPLATRSTRWHRWAFVALAALPVLIEATQAYVPLGRACDGMDVVDNWIGVALGCLIGGAAAWILSRRETPRDRKP